MYPWAENETKLASAKLNLKARGITKPTDLECAKEYVLMGGRIVHPDTGIIVDNNINGLLDERGQVIERDMEAVMAAVEEVIDAIHAHKPEEFAKDNRVVPKKLQTEEEAKAAKPTRVVPKKAEPVKLKPTLV